MFGTGFAAGRVMPDDKHTAWGEGRKEAGYETPPPDDDERSAGSESDSWDAYRQWLPQNRVSRSARGPLDPSLYTWKGYRNWAEEVKRNWSDRHRGDREES